MNRAELASIILGVVFVVVSWAVAAKRRSDLRRKNWWTVVIIGYVITYSVLGKVQFKLAELKTSSVVYGTLGLAAYCGFVYVWNLFEPKSSDPNREPKGSPQS